MRWPRSPLPSRSIPSRLHASVPVETAGESLPASSVSRDTETVQRARDVLLLDFLKIFGRLAEHAGLNSWGLAPNLMSLSNDRIKKLGPRAALMRIPWLVLFEDEWVRTHPDKASRLMEESSKKEKKKLRGGKPNSIPVTDSTTRVVLDRNQFKESVMNLEFRMPYEALEHPELCHIYRGYVEEARRECGRGERALDRVNMRLQSEPVVNEAALDLTFDFLSGGQPLLSPAILSFNLRRLLRYIDRTLYFFEFLSCIVIIRAEEMGGTERKSEGEEQEGEGGGVSSENETKQQEEGEGESASDPLPSADSLFEGGKRKGEKEEGGEGQRERGGVPVVRPSVKQVRMMDLVRLGNVAPLEDVLRSDSCILEALDGVVLSHFCRICRDALRDGGGMQEGNGNFVEQTESASTADFPLSPETANAPINSGGEPFDLMIEVPPFQQTLLDEGANKSFRDTGMRPVQKYRPFPPLHPRHPPPRVWPEEVEVSPETEERVGLNGNVGRGVSLSDLKGGRFGEEEREGVGIAEEEEEAEEDDEEEEKEENGEEEETEERGEGENKPQRKKKASRRSERNRAKRKIKREIREAAGPKTTYRDVYERMKKSRQEAAKAKKAAQPQVLSAKTKGEPPPS
uniref:Uncharacterized protein n=1 Tax=Chromera velia CCMP2878 TaxID=1169474 RepID=A0A0G4GI92_9ALVE|eukprot:Cvel_22017.t1-p1 / transcript=Cvel_22017.t1 / gene=Cvel_22017 / organism=Chromera_velia_CCMP2878 / gene_product=hypothetical protein / transcript_product=hypothetical protein / location=Cvel_scaffold2123:31342-33225(+) / protein_length=628 / sequence_SO=supercontig / SO=protein_coding / is_pseudo=false